MTEHRLNSLAVLVLLLFNAVAAAAQTTVGGGAEAPTPPEVARLAAALQSADFEARFAAISELRALENAFAARAAVIALKDDSETVRGAAVETVALLPAAESVPLLVPLLQKDKKDFVRQETAYALGKTRGGGEAVAPLITALQNDKNLNVRAAAAVALGELRDARAIEPLSRILLDNSKKIRRAEFLKRSAARSLGQIKDRQAVPALIVALQGTANYTDIRREAAFALGEIADSSAVQILRVNATADDPYLAEIARVALQKIAAKVDYTAPSI